MYIAIARNSPKPAYQQILESIKKQILTGELVTDEELPSIRQLAQDSQVSVITVRRAYSDLEREGLIYSRPGLGSFVANISREKLQEMKLAAIEPLLVEVITTARDLQLDMKKVEQLFSTISSEIIGGRDD